MLFTALQGMGQCPTLTFTSDRFAVCKLDMVTGKVSGMPSGCGFKYLIDSVWQVGTDRYAIQAGNAGDVLLNLELTLPNNDVCLYTNEVVATAKPLPEPQFQTSRKLLCNGADTLLLIDRTPNSAQRSWIINGKTSSNTPDSFIYAPSSFGTQHLSLVVDDSSGCRGIAAFPDAFAVYQDAGLEIVRSNMDQCLPYQSKFEAKYLIPGQNAVSILWSLPGSDKNGATSTEIPLVNYTAAGVFAAGVTLKTSQGCQYTALANPPVSLGEKFALSVQSSKKTACLSEWVEFEQTLTTVKGVLNWKSTAQGKKSTFNQNVALSVRDTGYFKLELENNHNGCISIWKSDSAVYIKGIKAAFSSQNAIHCAIPHKVQIKNNSEIGSSYKYKWQVIDPNSQTSVYSDTSRDLEHTVQTFPSRWHVRLILSADGCSDTAMVTDFIRLEPYTFKFFANPAIACPGQPVGFANNTTSPSYYGYDQYSWEFLSEDGKTQLGKSADLTPQFQYGSIGNYPVKIKGSNPLGCQFDSTAVLVRVLEPKLEFDMSKDKLCLNDSIRLMGKTTPLDAGYRHLWKVKHPTTSKEIYLQGNDVKAELNETGLWEIYCWLDIQGKCNDTLKKSVLVSGLKGQIALDTNTGCTPLLVRPRFKPEVNIHFGDTSGILKYDWSSDPNTGSSFKGQRAENPDWVVSEKGQYQARLYVSNSAGCGVYVNSGQISAGLKSELVLSKDKVCAGQSILAVNKTQGRPDQLKWLIDPMTNVGTHQLNPDTLEIRFNQVGKYKVTLVSSRYSGCSDSVTKWVEVSNLKAGFSLQDTIFSCAPVTVLMRDTSSLADSIIWITGDGKITRAKRGDFQYIYTLNSGNNKFYVQQIAFNQFGCIDTFTSQQGITVRGPVANFSLTGDKGCDTVLTRFAQKSENYVKFYLDFGDGSPIDSASLSNHIYRHSGTEIRKLYQPVLRVKDATGCEADFSDHPPIEIYAMPKGRIQLSPDSAVCQGEKIFVSNTGSHYSFQRWLLDQTLFGKRNPDTLDVFFTGTRTVQLVSYHDYGCFDTASVQVTGRSAGETELEKSPVICPGIPSEFRITTKGNQIPNQWSWNFGSPGSSGNVQTTTTSRTQFKYDQPGTYYLRYSARFANGCQIPKEDTIEVFNSVNIPIIDISAASYNDSQQVEVHYPGIFFDYFKRILLYKNDVFVLSDTLNAYRKVVDRNPGLRPEYALSITDVCGSEGKKGRTHIPVFAQVLKAGDKTLRLDWTYYVGWNRVDRYEVYRWSEEDTVALIATLFGTERTYTDSMLCPRKYTYKVVAVQDGLPIKAESNRVTEQPEFQSGLTKIDVHRVSVNDAEGVEIFWNPSAYKLHHQYQVERYLASGQKPEKTFTVNDTFFTDAEANPSRQPIWYKVRDVDYCGLSGEPGKEGATVHLKGINDNNISYLRWSAAQGLQPVHARQSLYYVHGNGSWQLVQDLPAVKLDYEDPVWYESVNGYYQYKVVVFNQSGDSSVSNLALVPGKPQFLIPSAFSPNSDGLNDNFIWKTKFVLNGPALSSPAFECRIFNRWGEQVYMSNDLNQGWDGTIDGTPLPEGLYIYRIQMTGSDFSRNHLQGTIFLTR